MARACRFRRNRPFLSRSVSEGFFLRESSVRGSSNRIRRARACRFRRNRPTLSEGSHCWLLAWLTWRVWRVSAYRACEARCACSACSRERAARCGCVIKDFDADPTVVIGLAQSCKDGHEIDITHARSLSIGIVGVEVSHVFGVVDNDLFNRIAFGAHGLHIQMQPQPWRVDALDDADCIGCVIQEVALSRPQRLQRKRNLMLLETGH